MAIGESTDGASVSSKEMSVPRYDSRCVPRDFNQATSTLQQAIDDPAQAPAPRAHLLSVQAQLEAIARGEFDEVLQQAQPDVTLDIFAPPEFAWVRHARGVADLRHAVEHNFGTVEDQRPEITNVLTETNVVVLFGRERGRVKSTGVAYDMEFVERFTFREDRLAAVRIIAAYTVPSA